MLYRISVHAQIKIALDYWRAEQKKYVQKYFVEDLYIDSQIKECTELLERLEDKQNLVG